MLGKTESQLHLSIWRPAIIDRGYLYASTNEQKEGVFVPVGDGKLLEQIYTWDAGPNDILGASTPSVGKRIKSKLVDPFASHQLPAQRSVQSFRSTVTEILTDPAIQSETYWTDCQETIKSDGDEEINVRANVALAVLRHFHWVGSVFHEVPRASVLIR